MNRLVSRFADDGDARRTRTWEPGVPARHDAPRVAARRAARPLANRRQPFQAMAVAMTPERPYPRVTALV